MINVLIYSNSYWLPVTDFSERNEESVKLLLNNYLIKGDIKMEEEKMTEKMENKKSTVKYMKEKYTVSEEAKSRSKKFIKLKKTILNTLKSGNKSIPQISKETDLSLGIVTYYLMTLRRYGFIAETGETTDDDYHLYKLQEIK